MGKKEEEEKGKQEGGRGEETETAATTYKSPALFGLQIPDLSLFPLALLHYLFYYFICAWVFSLLGCLCTKEARRRFHSPWNYSYRPL